MTINFTYSILSSDVISVSGSVWRSTAHSVDMYLSPVSKWSWLIHFYRVHIHENLSQIEKNWKKTASLSTLWAKLVEYWNRTNSNIIMVVLLLKYCNKSGKYVSNLISVCLLFLNYSNNFAITVQDDRLKSRSFNFSRFNYGILLLFKFMSAMNLIILWKIRKWQIEFHYRWELHYYNFYSMLEIFCVSFFLYGNCVLKLIVFL